MRISDYPKTLPRKEQYTAGEVAILYGVSHRTACRLIDQGIIKGFKVPGSLERRVLLRSIEAHVAADENYKHVLEKIEP